MRYYEYIREKGREMDKQRFKVGDRVKNNDGDVDYGTVLAVGDKGYEVLWDGCDRSYYCLGDAVIPSDEYSKASSSDNVNKPSHYGQGSIEAIDYIRDSLTREEFIGYLRGNIGKYLHRWRFKGKPLEDLRKARWYLDRLIERVEDAE